MLRPGMLSLLTALCLAAPGSQTDVAVRVEREAYLMGTRVAMVIYDESRQRGLERLEALLEILERTEGELSTWREDSALSAFNRAPVGEPFSLSPVLCRMFQEVWAGSAWTGGRFDPAVGVLLDAWGVQREGRLASTGEVIEALAHTGLSRIAFDRDRCTLTRRADVRLDAGAFGKGEALDRVAAQWNGDDPPWLVDLGGQVAVGGHPPGRDAWDVALAHPRRRSEPALELALDGGSIATTGGSERDVSAGGTRISHIVDPRTGRPATYRGSLTVWHERALVADMLSTALFIMGPEEGLAWADGHDIAACYLDPDEVGVRARGSQAFVQRFSTCATGGVPAR